MPGVKTGARNGAKNGHYGGRFLELRSDTFGLSLRLLPGQTYPNALKISNE